MSSAAFPLWPVEFLQWSFFAQAVTLALSTFVQEDAPTLAAALLWSSGNLPISTGFIGCSVGIWAGDAILYLLARAFGRPLIDWRWTRHWLRGDAIARSERWFAQRGAWLLLTSRFVPGTRLPTYLAAGFLRLSFPRFLALTGIAVTLWTSLLFLLVGWFGKSVFQWAGESLNQGWTWLLLVLLAALFWKTLTRFMNPTWRRRASAMCGRLRHWEFWPAWLFYFPVALQYLRLVVKYRGLTVPTAANPGIFSGGLVGESKVTTLLDLNASSPEFTAQACLIPVSSCVGRLALLDAFCARLPVAYPLILKPDVGQRGVGVKLIQTRAQAVDYLNAVQAPIVAQEYIPGPCEVGIFYYRLPEEATGRIFAITEKVFPMLVGDGRQTVEELIWQHPRCRFMADTYLRRLAPRRFEILATNETLRLVEAGNHAQGCIFQDGHHLWSQPLQDRIDSISQRLPGFFIGRYDIRYRDAADLQAGQNFKILELNGAAAEATSIYDARNSLGTAYRTLFQQWELVFRIGAANRQRGAQPTSPPLLWHKWRETSRLVRTYPVAD